MDNFKNAPVLTTETDNATPLEVIEPILEGFLMAVSNTNKLKLVQSL